MSFAKPQPPLRRAHLIWWRGPTTCEACVIGQKKASIHHQCLCHSMSFAWTTFNAMKNWKEQGQWMVSTTLHQERRNAWKCTLHAQISQRTMPMVQCACQRQFQQLLRHQHRPWSWMMMKMRSLVQQQQQIQLLRLRHQKAPRPPGHLCGGNSLAMGRMLSSVNPGQRRKPKRRPK